MFGNEMEWERTLSQVLRTEGFRGFNGSKRVASGRILGFRTLRFASLMLLSLFAATSSVALSSSASAADTPTKLYGILTDKDGAALSGIRISVAGPAGFAAEVKTGADGAWEVPITTKGTFAATINEGDLPDGQALTDPTKVTIKANVFMLGVDLRLLFPIGPGVEKASLLVR